MYIYKNKKLTKKRLKVTYKVKKKTFYNKTKNKRNISKAIEYIDDTIIKKHFGLFYKLLKFRKIHVYIRQLFRIKKHNIWNKKREKVVGKKPFTYKLFLIKFLNIPIRKKKKKKRNKYLKILRWIHRNNWKKKFFKKIKVLQKTFMQYYVQMSRYIFRKIHFSYKIFNNLTKFEKFFNYLEFRLPTIFVRLKYLRTYYQAAKIVSYGGVLVNGFCIAYLNFIIKLFDLLEIAHRFYRYCFSKRYFRYKNYFKRVRRQAVRIRYLNKKFKTRIKQLMKLVGLQGYFRHRNMFFFSRVNLFFEKNIRILNTIIIRPMYKFKYRKFTRFFLLRNLSLLMNFRV